MSSGQSHSIRSGAISLAETILAFGPSANARSAAAGSTPMISAIRHIARARFGGPQTVFAPRCHRGCSSRLKGIITGSSSLSPKYTRKRWPMGIPFMDEGKEFEEDAPFNRAVPRVDRLRPIRDIPSG